MPHIKDATVQSKSKPRMGNVRWFMIAFFIAGVTLNYIDRNALGILAGEIIKELNITEKQYSYIIGAFQAAYTIFQPVVGWFIDVVGLKIGFALMAVTWSVMCIFHAGASTWLHLGILRFLMGASEAAAAPANAKMMTEWFPKKERSVANGWGMVGFSLGAMLAPPLIYFIHQYWGWQAAFVIPGMVGVVWALLWWKFYSPPSQSQFISSTERDYILADQDAPYTGKKPSLWAALRDVAKEKKFYGIAIPAFLAEPAWAAVNFWVPLYLLTERGMALKQMAMFVWIPFLVADFGGVCGGYLARTLNKRFHFSRVNSAIITSFGAAVLMLSMAIASTVESAYVAIGLISIGALGHQIISSMLTVLVMEKYPAHQVATVNGFRGSSAWIASFLFTIILGQFVAAIGYKPFFIAMGFFDLIGVTVMILILAERRTGHKENASI